MTAPDNNARQRLAASFQRDVQVYAAHRPVYPIEAVRWLAGNSPHDVLDLGAGTGALTAALTSLGHRVVAAEPSASMVDALNAAGLSVPAVQCQAERLPFIAGSFDVVTVATAFHWFDASAALRETTSVLRPDGRLALVWNTREEQHGWPRQLGDLLRGAQPDGLTGDWGAGSVTRVAESSYFGPLEHMEFPFDQRLDRQGLVGLVASRSYVVDLSESRRLRLLENVGELFDEAAGEAEHVDLPYRAECWRSVRL